MLTQHVLNLSLLLSLGVMGYSTKGTSGLRKLQNELTDISQSHGSAEYDPSLGAPICRTVSSECSSWELLNGRGAIQGGNELNTPNTIDGKMLCLCMSRLINML